MVFVLPNNLTQYDLLHFRSTRAANSMGKGTWKSPTVDSRDSPGQHVSNVGPTYFCCY
jgi:hypothetical protein